MIRVRTIVISPPQQRQRSAGLFVISACVGMSLCRYCSSWISRLLLGCRKPKLRARRNPFGKTCCSRSRRNATPLTFGNLRGNKRLDRFTLRGRTKVDGQWKLYCLVHNFEKLAHHGYAA